MDKPGGDGSVGPNPHAGGPLPTGKGGGSQSGRGASEISGRERKGGNAAGFARQRLFVSPWPCRAEHGRVTRGHGELGSALGGAPAALVPRAGRARDARAQPWVLLRRAGSPEAAGAQGAAGPSPALAPNALQPGCGAEGKQILILYPPPALSSPSPPLPAFPHPMLCSLLLFFAKSVHSHLLTLSHSPRSVRILGAAR